MAGWASCSSAAGAKVPKVIQLPKTGAHSLLAGRSFPPQTGHNDLEYDKPGNLQHFLIVCVEEDPSIWEYSRARAVRAIRKEEEKQLGKVL